MGASGMGGGLAAPQMGQIQGPRMQANPQQAPPMGGGMGQGMPSAV